MRGCPPLTWSLALALATSYVTAGGATAGAGAVVELTDATFDGLVSADPGMPWMVVIGAPWRAPHVFLRSTEANPCQHLHEQASRLLLLKSALRTLQVSALQRARTHGERIGRAAERSLQGWQGTVPPVHSAIMNTVTFTNRCVFMR